MWLSVKVPVAGFSFSSFLLCFVLFFRAKHSTQKFRTKDNWEGSDLGLRIVSTRFIIRAVRANETRWGNLAFHLTMPAFARKRMVHANRRRRFQAQLGLPCKIQGVAYARVARPTPPWFVVLRRGAIFRRPCVRAVEITNKVAPRALCAHYQPVDSGFMTFLYITFCRLQGDVHIVYTLGLEEFRELKDSFYAKCKCWMHWIISALGLDGLQNANQLRI